MIFCHFLSEPIIFFSIRDLVDRTFRVLGTFTTKNHFGKNKNFCFWIRFLSFIFFCINFGRRDPVNGTRMVPVFHPTSGSPTNIGYDDPPPPHPPPGPVTGGCTGGTGTNILFTVAVVEPVFPTASV